ncbi:hypothetical protein Vadar_009802 [Vaccinium darrowii]|uniref:Uncharacterized protein n=1 Tax=Vaccinium darrowii TaxID=229202 RepID=A0ACB7ZAF8_9ERIC|nr:hypothetical protein Vadar_009802 [Vaccinium darrowii]
MSNLVSSLSKNVQAVPEEYILPKEKRPGDIAAPVCKDIPVIDLAQAEGLHQYEIIQKMMKASQEFGIFQVINHGISEELMDDTMMLFKEFFDMPADDKAVYFSEDQTKSFHLFTGKYCPQVSKVDNWRDVLRHKCQPLQEKIQSWPEKPARYREVVAAYVVEVKKLSLRILDLICEGLGIELGYFGDEMSRTQELSEAYGLQIFNDGKWVGVEPVPHGFLIGINDQLEIISNGKLKSALHRAVTNASTARTSLTVQTHLTEGVMSLFKEFFDMEAEEKAVYYSEDKTKSFRLYTNQYSPKASKVDSWRDTLHHLCHPLEEKIQSWPEKPARYREVVGTYVVEVKNLSLRILDLICEGLGIELGYFGDELSKAQRFVVNHYPPCPDPSLVLGVNGHYDSQILTLLQQEAYGLQIFNDGKWVGIEPLSDAFLIGINDQLEIISNGKLKSTFHRAVTNTSIAWTSLASFIGPSLESIIEPAKALVSESNPKLFKPISSKDYLDIYMAAAGGSKVSALETLKL